jgi:hypothetical protein
MRYFTRNPLERMMMQLPRAGRPEVKPPVPAPEGHHCFGCGCYGLGCMRPCYRDNKNNIDKEKTNEPVDYR